MEPTVLLQNRHYDQNYPKNKANQRTIKHLTKHGSASLLDFFGGLVALATAIGAGVYITKEWSEARATIDLSQSVDQEKPFSSPLLVLNRNPVLAMWDVRVACVISYEHKSKTGGHVVGTSNNWAFSYSGTSISPSKSANFYCNTPDKFSIHEGDSPIGGLIPLVSATMKAELTYNQYFIIKIPQHIIENFTMVNTSAGFKWFKGVVMNVP